jgi:GGDEF domain-containing protein
MRRIPYDLLILLFLVLAGLGLAFLPTTAPEHSAWLAGAVAATAFLIAALLVLAGLRPRLGRPAGFAPLLLGLSLLAAGAALSPFPNATAVATNWISPFRLSHDSFLGVTRAVGALGVALGFSIWVRSLVQRSVCAETRKITLEREMEHLGDKVRVQEETLRALDIFDSVTGVLNRRAFIAAFSQVAARDMRLKEPFAYVLISAAEPERHDPMERDRVVREISEVLRGATRGTDYIGRLSAVEFGVVLGECQDPQPAVDRIVFGLEGDAGARKKNPVRTHIAVVIADDLPERPEFADLSLLADRIISTLPQENDERVARARFFPGDRSTAQAS